MEKSPIITIYRSLDKKEQRELGKWLASPVHNQRADVKDLHAYLISGDHVNKTSALTKTRIWRKLFGSQPFDDARMRQTIHFASKAVEEWLSYRQWKQNDVQQRLALLAQYRQRNLDKLLEKTVRQLEQLQGKAVQRNESFFRNEYHLQQEKYALQLEGQNKKEGTLQDVATSLDQSYLIEKLRLCCMMFFHQKVHRVSFDIKMLDPVLTYVEEHDLTRIPSLAIYYYVAKCFTDEAQESHFSELLRQTVTQHEDVLPLGDLHEIYKMISNLIVSRLNRGQESYWLEAFEWYRIRSERNIMLENNQITRTSYLNAIASALKHREFAWAENFLEEYAPYLDEEIREETYGYAKARYLYDKGDYDNTMAILVRLDIKQPIYNLLAKTMLMKIYFQHQELDALDSLLESMSAYIRRKDLPEVHRKNFGNTVRFTRQLSRLEPYNKSKREALKQQIHETDLLHEKTWLLEQLKQM